MRIVLALFYFLVPAAVIGGLPEGDVFVGLSKLSKKDANALAGRIAYGQEDYEKAVAYFEAAFAAGPGYPVLDITECRSAEDACREYAKALRKLKRDKAADRAAAIIEGVLEKKPGKNGS